MEKLEMSLDEIVRREGTPKHQGNVRSAWGPKRASQESVARPEPYLYAPSLTRHPGRTTGVRGYRPCRVRPESDVHQTAGYLASAVRNGAALTVVADSAASLNQAVKSLALARSYLEEEGLDLTVRASLPARAVEADVALQLTPVTDNWVRDQIATLHAVELHVSSATDPSKVAGAIAKRVREESHMYCTAMGPQAILRAAKGIALARQFLAAEATELAFVPEFNTTEDGATRLHLYIFTVFRDCSVKPDSDVHQIAGYIAAGVRSGVPPVVLADSAACVNQAVKALALTRSYLEKEDLDIIVKPLFPDYYDDTTTASVKLMLSVVADNSIREEATSSRWLELYVSAESDPTKVAGAIAQRSREGGQIYLTGMGPQAVFRATKSLFLAQQYLQADAISPWFAPEFGRTKDGASVIHLQVLSEWRG